MNSTMTRAEIDAVFVQLNLSPIDRGMEEIQAARDRLVGYGPTSADGERIALRTFVSNGTGKPNTDNSKNAELERGSR